MTLQPVAAQTRMAAVAEQLRQAILDGGLAPGEALVETRLAEQMGVSRAPVREALRQLAEEGLVVNIPYKGTYVIELDPQRIAELYSLRTVLEEFAVRQAFPHLTAIDIERLTGYVTTMRAAADRDDLAETVRAHLQFHDEFYRLARHEVLYNMWRSVSHQTQLSINASFVAKGLHQAVDSHDEILRALHERNLEELATAMRNHIAEAGTQLAQLLAHDPQA